jgi:hypothetical protein
MGLVGDKTIADVVAEFLGSALTLEEIAVYRLPDELQTWAHELLEKNRAGSLSDVEHAQMEEFRQIDHLLTLVKATARLKLKTRPGVNPTAFAHECRGTHHGA